MSNITIEDAMDIIESAEIPELSAQSAIDHGLVEEPCIQARHDSQTNEVEISVVGDEWEVDSVFIEVCDGLVDSGDVRSAIDEVLDSVHEVDALRVPLQDLTAIVAGHPSAPAASACLTGLAESLRRQDRGAIG